MTSQEVKYDMRLRFRVGYAWKIYYRRNGFVKKKNFLSSLTGCGNRIETGKTKKVFQTKLCI